MAKRERKSAEESGHRGHHDGAKAKQTCLEDGVSRVLPSIRSARSAKSIIIIAFFLTIPISKTMPMMEITSSSLLRRIRAKTAPTLAEAEWKGS